MSVLSRARMWTGKRLASKGVILPRPLRPACRFAQVVGALFPTGVTIPMPVMAILFRSFIGLSGERISPARLRSAFLRCEFPQPKERGRWPAGLGALRIPVVRLAE